MALRRNGAVRGAEGRNRTLLAGLGAGLGAGLAARAVVGGLRRDDLDGQVAVVTGASRGLGFLLARTLADHGCRLVVCARDPDTLEDARRRLEDRGAEALAVPCDVADPEQAERLITQATDRFGQVDILVTNAGVIQVGPAAAMTRADFEQAIGVMLWGVLNPTLAVLPQMRERGAGRIVNITSIGGRVSAPHLLPYDTAKYAAVGLSRGLRVELSGSGIGVTTVVPGLMRTGSHVNARFKGQQRREAAWFSLGASLPLVSMDGERAAGRIVDAARRNQAELVLTPQAHLAARMQGLFPGTTVRLLSVANRLLPDDDGGDTSERRGGDLVDEQSPAPVRAATALGTEAVRRFQPDRDNDRA